jgi:hypothetical protein
LTLVEATKSMFHEYGLIPFSNRESVATAPNWKPMSLSPPISGNPAGS